MTTGAEVSFRNESNAIAPAFWCGPNGSSIRYAMAVLYDTLNDACEMSIQAQAPSIAPADALPFASVDRQIARGYQELEPSIRGRLIQWLDRWPYSGRAIGVLLFARGWILPQLPEILVVQQNGLWWELPDGYEPMPVGQQTVSSVTVSAVGGGVQPWDWDGQFSNWWRSWMIVYSVATVWCSPAPTIGTAGLLIGDQTISIGFANPSLIFTGLSAIVNQVKRLGQWYPYVIVAFDAGTFQPTSTGANAPDGDYAHWSKIVNGQYVRARAITSARYIGVKP